MARLLLLLLAVAGLASLGAWSGKLTLSLWCSALPALLHLALATAWRGRVLHQHRYVVLWIYGLPALAPVAWLCAGAVPPFLGGTIGNQLGFLLADAFRHKPVETQILTGLAFGGVALGLAWNCCSSVRATGWRRGLLGRPVVTLLAVAFVPVCLAVALAAGRSTLMLPMTYLAPAAPILHAVLHSEMLAARFVTLFVFPVGIAFCLLQGLARPGHNELPRKALARLAR